MKCVIIVRSPNPTLTSYNFDIHTEIDNNKYTLVWFEVKNDSDLNEKKLIEIINIIYIHDVIIWRTHNECIEPSL